jgi:hypothetical protein
MPRGKESTLTKPQRWDKIERMRNSNPSISYANMGRELGVSASTIQRDIEEMLTEGRTVPSGYGMALTQRQRDIVWESDDSTFALIDEALERTNTAHKALYDELGYEGEECMCCGRKPLASNPLWHQNFAKMAEVLDKQIQTRAKVRGELVDNVQITVAQLDADFLAIMQAIASVETLEIADLIKAKALVKSDGTVDVSAVTEALVRRLYANITETSLRRKKRLPAVIDIVEGTYEEVQ